MDPPPDHQKKNKNEKTRFKMLLCIYILTHVTK